MSWIISYFTETQKSPIPLRKYAKNTVCKSKTRNSALKLNRDNTIYNKYSITKEYLKKRAYGVSFDMVDDEFLRFIRNEKEQNNPFLSETNIQKLEKDTKKRIRNKIYIYGVLGMVSTAYGLYEFFMIPPRIGINLYTQMPVIGNGSIPIVLGLGLVIGSLYSYKKKEEVLVAKVKAIIIEHFKDLQKEKLSKRSLFGTNKKQNSQQQPKKKRKK